MLDVQELCASKDLQQLETDVNALLTEGRSLIVSNKDTEDIESTVDVVSQLLTDINQQVLHLLSLQSVLYCSCGY